MPYQPTIGRKVLFMALVPVLLGSFFLSILNFLWYSANDYVLREQACNERSIALSETFTAMTAYCYKVMDGAFRSAPMPQDTLDVAKLDAEKQLNRLAAILARDAEHCKNEIEIQKALNQAFLEVNEIANADFASRIEFNVQRVSTSWKMIKSGVKISDQIQSINKSNQLTLSLLRKGQTVIEPILELLVFITFACGGILSALLYFDFARRVIKRLKVLIQNASNLAKMELPTGTISGNDELAYLDASFRQVADELKSARDERQMIVQMIAHDMRSPIMAAQVSISTFEEFFVELLPERTMEWCDRIAVASDTVLTFINELLTIEAVESDTITLSLTEFSMRELVHNCILAVSHRSGLKLLSIENNCTATKVKADRSRLAQVITTYLNNAIDAAPEQSTITVSSRNKGGLETISVHDDGAPLTKQQWRLAFERYSQKNAADESLGLGLFMSKLLIEKHGGNVAAMSDAGTGRTFQFSVPLVATIEPARQSANGEAKSKATSPPAKKKPSMLRYFKGSLVSKVLLLVLIPLISQSIFLFWIDGQLARSQELANNERQQTDLISIVNEVWLRIFSANANSGLFTVYHQNSYKERALDDLEALNRTSDALELLMNRAPQTKSLWFDAKQFIWQETRAIQERIEKSGTELVDTELGHMSDFIEPALNVNARMAKIVAGEIGTLADITQQNEELRKQLQTLIFSAIAINAILSAGQWWALRRNVSRRITVLLENARQLPLRGPLKEPTGGSDEIAALDKLLHRAARELRISDDQRKSMMDLIAMKIGQPLKEITLYLNLLDGETSKVANFSQRGKEALSTTKRNLDRVRMLASDLLTIDQSSGLNNELEPNLCNIRDLLEESAASVRSLADKHGITFNIATSDFRVRLDRKRMVQVLVNLLANAVKFSPAQSEIYLAARTIGVDLEITVKDSGPGMDRATSEKIFEKFFRSNNQNQQAFGLGLAICKLLVEAHGGEIAVQSELGHGSTFIIDIPDAVSR